tara:strand:+ start:7188 stop:7403 length:216 start_codon:yes stop_codon:yes gene_type:complete
METLIPERFLRTPEIRQITGLSTNTIQTQVSDELFPQPIQLGEEVNVWLRSDVLQWLEEQTSEENNYENRN